MERDLQWWYEEMRFKVEILRSLSSLFYETAMIIKLRNSILTSTGVNFAKLTG